MCFPAAHRIRWLDEGLGHARVHVVVGHMVAHAVCGPSQGQLAQVARSHNHALVEFAKPEEMARPLACLNVLKRDVVDGLAFRKGMAYVLEHLHAARPDIDLPGQSSRSRRSSRLAWSRVRALVANPGMMQASMFDRGRAMTSMARAQTMRAWVESSPPDMPINDVLCPSRPEALHQSLHLDLVDLLAPFVLSFRVARDKRKPFVDAFEEEPSPGGDVRLHVHRAEPCEVLPVTSPQSG